MYDAARRRSPAWKYCCARRKEAAAVLDATRIIFETSVTALRFLVVDFRSIVEAEVVDLDFSQDSEETASSVMIPFPGVDQWRRKISRL